VDLDDEKNVDFEHLFSLLHEIDILIRGVECGFFSVEES
jgi:hypothetical protein